MFQALSLACQRPSAPWVSLSPGLLPVSVSLYIAPFNEDTCHTDQGPA